MVAAIGRKLRNVEIVEAILSGKDVKAIAADYSLSTMQVYRILNDDDYRQILQSEQRRQISLVPKATQVVTELMDCDDPKVRLAAAKTVHANTGITPAHTQSILIERLLIQQGNSSEDAAFRATAMEFLGLADPQPPIDVTPEDDYDLVCIRRDVR